MQCTKKNGFTSLADCVWFSKYNFIPIDPLFHWFFSEYNLIPIHPPSHDQIHLIGRLSLILLRIQSCPNPSTIAWPSHINCKLMLIGNNLREIESNMRTKSITRQTMDNGMALPRVPLSELGYNCDLMHCILML